jgi:hypothetical protein
MMLKRRFPDHGKRVGTSPALDDRQEAIPEQFVAGLAVDQPILQPRMFMELRFFEPLC